MQVINAENLSKQYVLGSRHSSSIRDTLTSLVSRRGEPKHTIWALRDVSFSVDDGETLGLIGRNGAGKSTLLKILSRITKPTSGAATIRGRVGSLLEVGTGFHSELSGRENIFMNGAILGMKRAEIRDKFDEIVEFSEIEEFLDTPVKHYSSGMYMRLAFSVAAHLDPEVLIVDEVLAVGDIAFQKKCLRKMRDVGESGRTVIFVSHDMQSISRLCKRAIWLDGGQAKLDGPAEDVVSSYLVHQTQAGAERSFSDVDAPGNETVRLRHVRICDTTEKKSAFTVDVRQPFAIELTYDVLQSGKVLAPNIQLYNDAGVCVFVSIDQDETWRGKPRPAGTYLSRALVPGNFLAEGNFNVSVVIATHQPLEVHLSETDVVGFNVVDPLHGDSARGDYGGKLHGVVSPKLEWETETKSD